MKDAEQSKTLSQTFADTSSAVIKGRVSQGFEISEYPITFFSFRGNIKAQTEGSMTDNDA